MSRLPKRMLSCILAAVACFTAGLSVIYLSDAYQHVLRLGIEVSAASISKVLGENVSLVWLCFAAALVCVLLIAAIYISVRNDPQLRTGILICAVSGIMVMLVFFLCVFIVLSTPDLMAGLPLSVVLLDRSCLIPGLLTLVCLYVLVRLIRKRNAAV